jgi:hypothetical protein
VPVENTSESKGKGKKGKPKQEDDEDEDLQEEEFEENSRFNPNKGVGEFVTAYRKLSEETPIDFEEELEENDDLKIESLKFGSKQTYRRSNENLFNLAHLINLERYDDGHPNAKILNKLAE